MITITFPETMAENSVPQAILSKETTDKLAGFFSDPYFDNYMYEKENEVRRVMTKNGYSEFEVSLIKIAEISNIRLHEGGYMDVILKINVKNDLFDETITVYEGRFRYNSYNYQTNLNYKGSSLKTSVRADVDRYQSLENQAILDKIINKIRRKK